MMITNFVLSSDWSVTRLCQETYQLELCAKFVKPIHKTELLYQLHIAKQIEFLKSEWAWLISKMIFFIYL